MFTLIRRLQQKPESQRRAVALWAALAVTAVIVVVWLGSFIVRLDRITTAPPQQDTDVSPVQSMRELLGSFTTLLKERW